MIWWMWLIFAAAVVLTVWAMFGCASIGDSARRELDEVGAGADTFRREWPLARTDSKRETA